MSAPLLAHTTACLCQLSAWQYSSAHFLNAALPDEPAKNPRFAGGVLALLLTPPPPAGPPSLVECLDTPGPCSPAAGPAMLVLVPGLEYTGSCVPDPVFLLLPGPVDIAAAVPPLPLPAPAPPTSALCRSVAAAVISAVVEAGRGSPATPAAAGQPGSSEPEVPHDAIPLLLSCPGSKQQASSFHACWSFPAP